MTVNVCSKLFMPLALIKYGRTAIAGIAIAGAALGVQAQTITVASTTSTEQSGLFAHLLPEFKKASGIDVKVVALGTGQAIDMGRRGDADVLFVHDNGIGPPLPMLPNLLEMTDDELAESSDVDGEQPSLHRIQQSLWALGGELTLMAPRLGGTSLRIILPRSMQDERSAA